MGKLFNVQQEKYKGEKKYSTGLRIPQYLPSGIDVDLAGCIDKTKYNELVTMINNSNLPEEKKAIYRVVATRFIEFRFDSFAEYYANLKNATDKTAAKEEQEVMEKLALVIVDINNAIHNGFVKMNSFIEDILMNSDKYKKDIKEMEGISMGPLNEAALSKQEIKPGE